MSDRNNPCRKCGTIPYYDGHREWCTALTEEAMEAVAEKLQSLIDRVTMLEQTATKYRGHRHLSGEGVSTTPPNPSNR